MGLLCLQRGELGLGMGNESDYTALLLDQVELLLELLGLLSSVGLVFGEGSLGIVAVFVETAFGRLGDVAGPDGVCLLDPLWSHDVAYNSGANHSWSIEHSSRLDNLLYNLLISATLFNESHDVSASCFIGNKTSKMSWFRSIILGERFDVWSREHAFLLW